jgi:hypothetical protein
MGFMDQLDEEYAPSWKSQPGDTVQGIVIRKNYREGDFGLYPILTLQRISGNPEALTPEQIAVHCNATGLHKWVDEEEHVAIGDRVGFRDDGKKKSKDGKRTYSAFSKTRQPAELVPHELRVPGLIPGPAPTDNAAAAPSSPAPAAAAPAHGQPAQAQGEPW